MGTIRFAVLLGLILVAAQVHHLVAQSADEAAIKRIERIWDDNWNRHDPKGMAAVPAEDVDFVNVNGERFKGRSAFQALMTRAHAMQFKDSTRTTLATTVKFLTPEIAAVGVVSRYDSPGPVSFDDNASHDTFTRLRQQGAVSPSITADSPGGVTSRASVRSRRVVQRQQALEIAGDIRA